MIVALLRVFSRLPLPVIHWAGVVLGWITYHCSGRYARRLRDNLRQSHLYAGPSEYRNLLRESIREAGKAGTEAAAIWLRPLDEVLGLVRSCEGWHHVEAAHARGHGIIFVTPHLGCFEITALYIARRLPLTFLYSPPKMAWLDPLMRAGRERAQAVGVAPGIGGIRRLVRALRDNGTVGILPDQVPGAADGIWVDFFGRPAYTMTLTARLQAMADASVILVCARRLRRGQGYEMVFEPFRVPQPNDPARFTADLNVAVENLIRRCPAQYLWSYNRYKDPPASPAAAG